MQHTGFPGIGADLTVKTGTNALNGCYARMAVENSATVPPDKQLSILQNKWKLYWDYRVGDYKNAVDAFNNLRTNASNATNYAKEVKR